MAKWKKIITSGSNAALTNITSSGNISASGELFFSASLNTNSSLKTLVINTDTGQIFHTGSYAGAGGSGVATEIALGESTSGNNNFSAGTSVQDAIDDIDSILALLAPSKPPNLSAISLNFSGTTPYSAKDINGDTSSSIINNTSPSFVSSENFYNGDSGVLRAQHFPSSSGDVGTGYNSGFSIFDIDLDANENTGSNSILQIVSDSDPYEGITGQAGFYKELSAKINLSGLTPNNVGDYQRNTVRLIHTQTGVNGIDKEFTLDSDPASSITNLNTTYTETDNFHYQSGIKYLGNDDIIQSHYTVTINSNANFINSLGRISAVTATNFDSGIKSINTSWTPGGSYNVTHSMNVQDSKFNIGSVTFNGKNYKASSTSTNATDDTSTISNLLIDSKTENEITPTSGVTRVKSGNGQYPSSGSSVDNFIGEFSSATELTTSDEYELQFSNQFYHWPAATNYTNYIPSGPNYTGISGDSSNNNLRYATFKLGTINASSVTIILKSVYGFDSAALQSSDNFQLFIKVIDGLDSTNWFDANAGFGGGTPTAQGTGVVVLAQSSTTVSNGGDYTRVLTFGEATRTGTLYVRVGWSVSGGTSANSNSTRKFKYIYKT